MEEVVHFKDKQDSSDFQERLRILEGLGLSGTQRAEYNYLRTHAESTFNLDENAKYAMLDLFVELTTDASSVESSGPSQGDKENAKAYMAYISQSFIDRFYKQGAHRIGQSVSQNDITILRGEIETARNRSSNISNASGVVEGLYEWPTFTEYTGNLRQYQFATSIHMLQRSWHEYTNLVTKSVFDKFRWRKAGRYFDYDTSPKIDGTMLNLPFHFGFDSSKKYGGISGKFDLNNMGSPMLGDIMEWATSPSKWDLLIRPVDIMGGDVQEMIDDISYPALLRGSADFKRQLVIQTEKFIRDNLSSVNSSTTPATFKKLYEKYDEDIRGTDSREGLWDTYLKPELIGKDAEIRFTQKPGGGSTGGGGKESPGSGRKRPRKKPKEDPGATPEATRVAEATSAFKKETQRTGSQYFGAKFLTARHGRAGTSVYISYELDGKKNRVQYQDGKFL